VELVVKARRSGPLTVTDYAILILIGLAVLVIVFGLTSLLAEWLAPGCTTREVC
jgi:hypothetical protein